MLWSELRSCRPDAGSPRRSPSFSVCTFFLVYVSLGRCATLTEWRPKDSSRPDLIIEYATSGGLFNQHQVHVQTLELAVALKASTLEWPPSRDRETYTKGAGSQAWHLHSAADIYDMDSIASYFRENFDLKIAVMDYRTFRVPASNEVCLCDARGRATPVCLPLERQIRFGMTPFRELTDLVQARIGALREAHPDQSTADVRLRLDQPFHMHSGVPAAFHDQILRGLVHAERMHRLAAKVMRGMEDVFGADHKFNGMHLRMEVGAATFQAAAGGKAQLWEMYKDIMRDARLDPDAPMLVASGLVQAGFSEPLNLGRLMFYSGDIMCNRWAKRVVFKEMWLTDKDLETVGVEDRGIIDYILLRAANVTVGVSSSSFSNSLQTYRKLDGVPDERNTKVMVPKLAPSAKERAALTRQVVAEEAKAMTLY